MAKTLPLNVISHPKNLGPSEAIKSGLLKTAAEAENSDFLVLMEGDGTSDPKILGQIIQKLRMGFDVVVCSRFAKGGA